MDEKTAETGEGATAPGVRAAGPGDRLEVVLRTEMTRASDGAGAGFGGEAELEGHW